MVGTRVATSLWRRHANLPTGSLCVRRAVFQRFELFDPTHGIVPCATLTPVSETEPLPVCLFLHGGGGSRESLATLAERLEDAWASAVLPPLRLATPDVGPWSFYLDDPERGLAWESFIADRFVPHLLAPLGAAHVGVVGVSMGGYGALKLAFARPWLYAAAAAVSPMLEPSEVAEPVRLRNRYFYPAEVPAALLGPQRDAALYHRDHPAARARLMRDPAPAIYVDAAGADALHAHDGAEHLHRVLWDLDVPHEYRLRVNSDHVGPDLPERLVDAFVWVGQRLQPRAAPVLSDLECEWQRHLDGETTSPPAAPLPAASPLAPRLLRAQLSAERSLAAAMDPTVLRTYGRLT